MSMDSNQVEVGDILHFKEYFRSDLNDCIHTPNCGHMRIRDGFVSLTNAGFQNYLLYNRTGKVITKEGEGSITVELLGNPHKQVSVSSVFIEAVAEKLKTSEVESVLNTQERERKNVLALIKNARKEKNRQRLPLRLAANGHDRCCSSVHSKYCMERLPHMPTYSGHFESIKTGTRREWVNVLCFAEEIKAIETFLSIHGISPEQKLLFPEGVLLIKDAQFHIDEETLVGQFQRADRTIEFNMMNACIPGNCHCGLLTYKYRNAAYRDVI